MRADGALPEPDASEPDASEPDNSELDVSKAIRESASGGVFLLDVREADEWAAGHAPAATFIPLSELEARVAEVPTDRRVAVLCRSGARSARATGFLLASGVSATNVIGGMQAWQAAGGALEAESDASPQVI